MVVCAVLHKGKWYIAELVLATAYGGPEDTTHFDEPVWSEQETTGYICKHTEADTIIPLKEDL